jgi:hypothetical protein
MKMLIIPEVFALNPAHVIGVSNVGDEDRITVTCRDNQVFKITRSALTFEEFIRLWNEATPTEARES